MYNCKLVDSVNVFIVEHQNKIYLRESQLHRVLFFIFIGASFVSLSCIVRDLDRILGELG